MNVKSTLVWLCLVIFSALTANANEKMVVNPELKIITNQGDITIELFADQAPISVKNFLDYVDSGFYEGTVFHRIIADFMVQGGGFTTDMKRKTTRPSIVNEADNGLKNDRGTLAMARTSVVNSATSQFFINVKDNAWLNHNPRNFGYAVFGRVTNGMDIVDKLSKVATGRQDRPISPIVIRSITRI